jgi:radical SAM superfamily enzyme YgiQ (UPF0313 family)
MKSNRPPPPGPVLLLTPPLVQLNAPYPATAWLAGFLRERGQPCVQEDLSLALALRLFSRDGLRQVESSLRAASPASRAPSVLHVLKHAAACQSSVEPVIRFLQGRDDTLAYRIAARAWLPEGPRFQPLAASPSPLDAFGPADVRDKARHLASLFLDDLADAVRDGLDPRFAFARYADHLAISAPSFDPVAAALGADPSFTDRLIDDLAAEAHARHKPRFAGLTVPFPGTLYGALRIARALKKRDPAIRIALGGGYVNTELRALAEPRLFDVVDYVTLDDGEIPLLRAIAHAAGTIGDDRLVRTFVRRHGKVVFLDAPAGEPDPPALAGITPAYEDLPLERYVSLAESANPMHRLWSDGLWLKLPAARGCYWHRCRFCDVSLPYIARYSPTPADALADKLETLIARTGRTGFHFTDEALAPGLLSGLSDRLIARGIPAVWWGNIRFEKGFTPELAGKMAAAGCVAVTGGLECAHDRLLALMDKGVTLKDAARACAAFSGAGILVHAYLMTGFPTQTLQETVDGLEFVRQCFEGGVIQSAFWHRFALTAHSSMAREPARYGIQLLPRPAGGFACNEIPFEEPGAPDPVELEACLRRATYNFMHGVCLDQPVHKWFPGRAPKTRLAPVSVARWIRAR